MIVHWCIHRGLQTTDYVGVNVATQLACDCYAMIENSGEEHIVIVLDFSLRTANSVKKRVYSISMYKNNNNKIG